MDRRRLAIAVVAAMMVALVTPMVLADMSGAVAHIVHADRLSTRVAENGDTRVVPMVQGESGYLGEFVLAANGELETGPQEREQYLYVLTGSAVLTVDDETYLVGPRMGVYLPEGASVQWTNGSSRLVAVQFLAGPRAGAEFYQWPIDDSAPPWPRPRLRPRPAPAGVSAR